MRISAVFFFILICLTCYVAGMYRSMPLMALGVGELFLTVVLAFLPRYFLSRLSVAFKSSGESACEGSDVPCHITVRNSGRLPIGRFELCLRCSCLRDDRYMRAELYGGAGPGESSMKFVLSVKYCGMAQVTLDRLRVFDYLLFFRAGKFLDEKMRIAVFPGQQALRIRFSSAGWRQDKSVEDETVNLQGDAYDEIRQIREYQSGESRRHIHWNQSARTESLWVKEYESRTDCRIDILIDSTGFSRASVMELSAFYRTLSALVRGILGEGAVARVHWHHDDMDCMVDMDVTDVERCEDMLLQLYQMNFSHEGNFMEKADFPSFLRLTRDLALFKGDEWICQFSLENLDSELREKVVDI